MLYKFKSKAAGDVIMLAESGDQVLRILGREPVAKGILEVNVLATAMQALEAAVTRDEEAREQARADAAAEGKTLSARDAVTLRQRVWPLREMMKRSLADKADIVWGV